jgi:UDP-N-acetylglucosamine acyltransferase
LNTIGLKRKGFSDEVIGDLKKAYKIIFRSGLTLEDAFKKAVEAFPNSKEVNYFVDFMRHSKRGVTR